MKIAKPQNNLAVAEKLAHMQHEKWLARCPKASPASIAKALEILGRQTPQAPEAEDMLPEGYISQRHVSTVKP